MGERYVCVEIDASLPPGKVRVGGVRVVEATREALWQGLHTTVVAVGNEHEATGLRETVAATHGLQLIGDERGSDA